MSQALAATAPPTSAAAPEDPAALVRAAQADPRAFGPIYRRYVSQVYAYALVRVGDRDAAEDITSQVFADALAGLNRYRERGEFLAWLFRIVRRRVADYYRERAREGSAQADPTDDPFPAVDADLDRAPTRRALLGRVAGLDAEHQEILRLRFAAELSYPEIGAVLDRPPDAVKMVLHRLLSRLAKEMEVNHDRAL